MQGQQKERNCKQENTPTHTHTRTQLPLSGFAALESVDYLHIQEMTFSSPTALQAFTSLRPPSEYLTLQSLAGITEITFPAFPRTANSWELTISLTLAYLNEVTDVSGLSGFAGANQIFVCFWLFRCLSFSCTTSLRGGLPSTLMCRRVCCLI